MFKDEDNVDSNDNFIDSIVGYSPSQQTSANDFDFMNKLDEEVEGKKKASFSNMKKENNRKSQAEILMDIANENIDLLFKDQYGDGHARILNNDHYETLQINSSKFEIFLSKLYYENEGEIINKESINNVAYTLRAKAVLGDIKYDLSLRVAEYQGDFYYDLTDDKYRCIRISKDGTWQILDETPIPLFRRYNQIPQDLPCSSFVETDDKFENKQLDNPLEIFVSELTNIKDPETKLLVKVSLISYFIPKISHIVLIIHGGKGSAKSTFQRLLKNIVDPAKPELLTLHDNHSEFVQQLSQLLGNL